MAITPPDVPLSKDMLDPETEVGEYAELRGVLLVCKPVIDTFYAAEAQAFKHQAKYRRNANRAALWGTLAIGLGALLLVLMQLNNTQESSGTQELSHLRWLLVLVTLAELGTAIAAMVIVTLGVFASDKEQWLLERNRAERCRLLKFKLLTDPELWKNATSSDKPAQLLSEIQCADLDELKTWIAKDPPPQLPSSSLDGQISVSALRQLVDYYNKKRLLFQMDYLALTARRCEEKHRPKRFQFSFLFYASIFAVFLHSVAGIPHLLAEFRIPAPPPEVTTLMTLLSLVFLFGAIVLPALSAGLRTSHLANELARNASRYRAKHYALGELSERLNQAVNHHGTDAVFRELGFCEQVLDLDQREWLRLMIEAEWF